MTFQIGDQLVAFLNGNAVFHVPALANRGIQQLSTVPTLVIGLQPEIDAWLAAKQLPARPDEINKKGTAQAWTLARADGASPTICPQKMLYHISWSTSG